jgi:methylmalonyl-CoA/ethylmalonyl-CoA epimerase
MNKIEHIGIAVKDLKTSNTVFAKILGVSHYKEEHIAHEGVNTSFFKVGNEKIELLEAVNSSSTIAKFLNSKGEGVHHIAFSVDNITTEIERLKLEGFTIINETPKRGADNKLVAFYTPKLQMVC